MKFHENFPLRNEELVALLLGTDPGVPPRKRTYTQFDFIAAHFHIFCCKRYVVLYETNLQKLLSNISYFIIQKRLVISVCKTFIL